MAEHKDLVTVELPEPVARRGVSEAEWRTLCNSLYPGADPKSVLLVLDYCTARQLDPMKKPCHIVPMQVKDARSGEYQWRDVVMPGIYEYRTTAHRTGDYLGHSEVVYGPEKDFQGVTAPEWASMVMYRWNPKANQREEFPVKVFFREVVATNKEGKPNARWTRAPIQMMVKCLEASGIREGYPEEIGGVPTAEEMDGQRAIDAEPVRALPAVTNPLDGVDDDLCQQIEALFEVLKIAPGLRLAKLNEFLAGATDSDRPSKATKLFQWLHDEVERQGAKGAKRFSEGNGKSKPTPAASPSESSLGQVATSREGVSTERPGNPVGPERGDSGQPSGLSTTALGTPLNRIASKTVAKELTLEDLPFSF